MRRWGWRHAARMLPATAPASLLLPAPSLSLLSLNIIRNHDGLPRLDMFSTSTKMAAKSHRRRKGTKGTKEKTVEDEYIVNTMVEVASSMSPTWRPGPGSASQAYHDGQPRHTSTSAAWPGFAEVAEQPSPRELEYTKLIMPNLDLRNKMRNELPKLPDNLFRDPESVLSRLASFKTSWTVQREWPNYSCLLTASYLDQSFQTIGHARSKLDARRAAFQCMIYEFYERGIFHPIFSALDELPPRVIQEEKYALVQVYDYAAAYGYIPTIALRRAGNRHAHAWIAEIALPEHDILVTARSRDPAHAEIAAALKFKRAAEEFQLKRQSMGDRDAEEKSPLSSTTFTSFAAYLKDTNTPGVNVDMAVEQKILGFRVAIAIDGQPTGHVVFARSKNTAMTLAGLVGSVVIARQHPELLKSFADVLEAHDGIYLRKTIPVTLDLPANAIKEMRGINQLVQSRLGRQRHGDREDLDGNEAAATRRFGNPTLTANQQAQRVEKSEFLKQKLHEYEERPDLKEARQLRSKLPMSQNAPKLLELVNNNIYSIVIGATGSGKTTQVPQILLDEAIRKGEGAFCNIICTQPRRIAATSVAMRVAVERAESLQQTVGYHVRFDSRPPQPHGSILYATTAILLQQVQKSPDYILDHASHIVIDEVHDRDINVDLLLLALKKAMAERAQKGLKIPRVILMSATIDPEFFANYFRGTLPPNYQGTVGNECPSLSVPGRTFPVEEHYLDHIMAKLEKEYGHKALTQLLDSDKDSRKYVEAEMEEAAQPMPIDWVATSDADAQRDALVPLALTAATIAHIAKITNDDGGILVFLPGLDEILKVSETLQRQQLLGVDFKDQNNFRILMLHSSIQDSQQSVFEALPPGCRKIILSTNIAETSVTLPDVRYVVDTGKLRQKAYDQRRRITSLECTWISKSNARQRAGRAGRVANGSYYALYTRRRRESMRQTGLPELLRCDLQETCLLIKSHESSMKLPIGELLSQVLEPPPPATVALAVQRLKSLGAIDKNDNILPLGRVLALLPVHPSLGKMIVLGIIFRCLSPMIVLGSAVGERNPFITPLDQKREARHKKNTTFVRGSWSDHMALLEAYKQFTEVLVREGDRAASRWCYDHFVGFHTMKSMHSTTKQIEDILVVMGLAKKLTTGSSASDFNTSLHPSMNENAGSDSVIRALLAAGLSPNMAQSHRPGKFRTASELTTMLSQDSANLTLDPAKSFEAHILVFSSLVLSNNSKAVFLRETTLITPFMALLFGARLRSRWLSGFEIDDWLRLFVRSEGMPHHDAIRILSQFSQGLETVIAYALRALLNKRPLSNDPVLAHVARSLPRLLAWTTPPKPSESSTAGETSTARDTRAARDTRTARDTRDSQRNKHGQRDEDDQRDEDSQRDRYG
ncbi:P-loop containing nucleoside triphosphate hydrolase protein [Nemania serpens]|nr:P-loop containing nucleoside triphosphate hydrolase protein [Nemania serpens]